MSAGVEASAVDVGSLMADVIEITKELFPGVVSIDVTEDPEFPKTRLTAIVAQASGPVESIVSRRGEWHERVAQLGEPCSNLCLSFNFPE
jgi:hypothetical protein